MIGLLDVNVLIALVWPNHVHHSHASDWFVANREQGCATSPVTESGFVSVVEYPLHTDGRVTLGGDRHAPPAPFVA